MNNFTPSEPAMAKFLITLLPDSTLPFEALVADRNGIKCVSIRVPLLERDGRRNDNT